MYFSIWAGLSCLLKESEVVALLSQQRWAMDPDVSDVS